jgi:hypothetical protein
VLGVTELLLPDETLEREELTLDELTDDGTKLLELEREVLTLDALVLGQLPPAVQACCQ